SCPSTYHSRHLTKPPPPIPFPSASTTGLDLILRPPIVFLPLAGLAGLVGAVGWWLFAVFPRQQRTMPTAAITHRSTRPTWGAAPPEIASEREGPRPAWPTSPPLPAQPYRSDPPPAAREECPEGTDEGPDGPAAPRRRPAGR